MYSKRERLTERYQFTRLIDESNSVFAQCVTNSLNSFSSYMTKHDRDTSLIATVLSAEFCFKTVSRLLAI